MPELADGDLAQMVFKKRFICTVHIRLACILIAWTVTAPQDGPGPVVTILVPLTMFKWNYHVFVPLVKGGGKSFVSATLIYVEKVKTPGGVTL